LNKNKFLKMNRENQLLFRHVNIYKIVRRIKIGLICVTICFAFLLFNNTDDIKSEQVSYQEIGSVEKYDTALQGFDLKSSLLISIGLGASFSIVHTNNRKTLKDS